MKFFLVLPLIFISMSSFAAEKPVRKPNSETGQNSLIFRMSCEEMREFERSLFETHKLIDKKVISMAHYARGKYEGYKQDREDYDQAYGAQSDKLRDLRDLISQNCGN